MDYEYDFESPHEYILLKRSFKEFPVGTRFHRYNAMLYLVQDGRLLGTLGEPFGNENGLYVFDAKSLAGLNSPRTKGIFGKSVVDCDLFACECGVDAYTHQYLKGHYDTGNGIFHFHFATCVFFRSFDGNFLRRIQGFETPAGFAPYGFPMIRARNDLLPDGQIGLLKEDDIHHLMVKATEYALRKAKTYLAGLCKGKDVTFDIFLAMGPHHNKDFKPSHIFGWKKELEGQYDRKLYDQIIDHLMDYGNEYLRSIGIDDGWLDIGNYHPATCTPMYLNVEGITWDYGEGDGAARGNGSESASNTNIKYK